MSRAINLIVIHCSGSPNGRPLSVDAIRQEHHARGFSDIGYHWVIGVGGKVEPGRPEDEMGAHVKGYNPHSLGLCMVGTDRFSWEAWNALKAKVLEMKGRFPGARICGHRDLSPDLDGDGQIEPHEWIKTCPGFDVTKWVLHDMRPDPFHVIPGTGV